MKWNNQKLPIMLWASIGLAAIWLISPVWAVTGVYTLNGGSDSQTGKTYAAVSTDQSSVYVLNSGNLTLSNCTTTKTGDSSDTNASSQYGTNAGILATSAGTITINGGSVTTNASGANGIFATGSGSSISMSNGTITASGGNAHGVDATYGGSITLSNVNVTSNGASSSTLATDFGGGTVTVTGGIIISADTSANSHSAGIYSTGVITVSNATVVSYGDCGGVIDGANTIALNTTYLTGKVEGIKIWKTAPATGAAVVTINGGALISTEGDGFYVNGETGNAATAALTVSNGATITAGTGNMVNVLSSSSASFTAINDTLSGNLYADSASYIAASLNTTTLTGAATRVGMTITPASIWNINGISTTIYIANSGTIKFTSSGITLANTGAFSQTATGKLSIKLGSVSSYNQIAVTGAATLNGTLEVNLVNGYTPTIGQTFTIITRGSGSGTFSMLTSTSNLSYTVTYNTSNIQITITAVSSSPYLNTYGDFTVSSDTSYWYWEKYGDGTGSGTLSWTGSFMSQTGIVKMTQSAGEKGKITQIFAVPSTGWYTAITKVATDIADTAKQQKVYLYLQELDSISAVAATGNLVMQSGNGGFGQASTWRDLSISFYCQSTIIGVQVVGINPASSGISGSLYIDSIWVYTAGPDVTSSLPINNGSFNAGTTGWLVNVYADGTGIGTWSEVSSLSSRTGIVCGTQAGGEKTKLSQIYSTGTDQTLASVWVYSNATSSSLVQKVYLYIYSYDSGFSKVIESGNGILQSGKWSPGQWQQIQFGYTPLTEYNAVQVVGINPSGNPTASIYFDAIDLEQ
ncbi:MAG: beta strand repeat-containing protein [bacterium]